MVPCLGAPNVVHLISLTVSQLSTTKFRQLNKLSAEPDILTTAAAAVL